MLKNDTLLGTNDTKNCLSNLNKKMDQKICPDRYYRFYNN